MLKSQQNNTSVNNDEPIFLAVNPTKPLLAWCFPPIQLLCLGVLFVIAIKHGAWLLSAYLPQHTALGFSASLLFVVWVLLSCLIESRRWTVKRVIPVSSIKPNNSNDQQGQKHGYFFHAVTLADYFAFFKACLRSKSILWLPIGILVVLLSQWLSPHLAVPFNTLGSGVGIALSGLAILSPYSRLLFTDRSVQSRFLSLVLVFLFLFGLTLNSTTTASVISGLVNEFLRWTSFFFLLGFALPIPQQISKFVATGSSDNEAQEGVQS